jgi:hypothetical protein
MEIPIMAHFAELESNNIVLRVLVVANFVIENDSEQTGINFLKNLYGQNTIWKQTSYNTRGGVYYIPNSTPPSADPDQSKAFRKNYAGIGFTYDPVRDAFINPKPIVDPENEQYVTFDEFACLWKYNPPEEEVPTIRVTSL